MDNLIEQSVKGPWGVTVDCDVKFEIEGETWIAHDCAVAYRDLLFSCDKGSVTYLVDSYGDRHVAVIHDWERG